MVAKQLNDLLGPLRARPITLEFSGHAKPRNRLGPRGHEAADCHVVRLWRDASRGVGDDVDVIAVTHRMDSTICAAASAFPRALSTPSSADNMPAPPVAMAARMNLSREVRGAATSALCSKSFFMSCSGT